MTNSPQDELDRLSNPQEAQKAEEARSRSNFRPPWTKCVCDITKLEGPYDAMLENGTHVRRIALHLTNMRNIEGVTPFTGTEFALELGIPQATERGPAQPNMNSELVLTVASAQAIAPNITSVRGLVGLKGVRLEERVHKYAARLQQPRNSGNWVDGELQTRYYHVVAIGATGSANGSRPTVTDERATEAMVQITGLSHADAMEALGEDAGAVISHLVLGKRVSQVEGVYQPTV